MYKIYISSGGGILLVYGFILGGGSTFQNFKIDFIFTGYPSAPMLEGYTYREEEGGKGEIIKDQRVDDCNE